MTAIAQPAWAVGHRWTLEQLDALTARWIRGGARPCLHRLQPVDGERTVFVACTAQVLCSFCAIGAQVSLSKRAARHGRCDACGETARLGFAFTATAVRPADVLLAALCSTCLRDGPGLIPSTRELPWAADSPWVQARIVEALLSWSSGDAATCPHRRVLDLLKPPTLTILDASVPSARCPSCQRDTPHPQSFTRRCDVCSARDALFIGRAEHVDSPEYVLLVAVCETCAPEGPVTSK